MTLTLMHVGRVWFVFKGAASVAEIHLDYCDQVGEVVLYADSADDIQLQVLRLAASHVQQYMKNRMVSAFGGIMVAEYRDNSLTAADSYRLMNFELIPEMVAKLTREVIVRELGSLNVDVVVATYKRVEDAIEAAISQVGVPSLRCGKSRQRVIFDNEMALQFTVAKPERFIFWKSESVPNPRYEGLHVVPSYHPVMNGWEALGMVNGDTDAFIRGYAVRSIHCPAASLANRHERRGMGSWTHVKHPYYAVGRTMSLNIVTTKMRSKEGVKMLAELLRAALGQGKRFVEVSGGFRAPMKCAHNRLHELRRRSPWPHAAKRGESGHVARGSEEHCVWTYRVLKEEGKLETSHVPSWFVTEDWLGIYEGAEVRHGLF